MELLRRLIIEAAASLAVCLVVILASSGSTDGDAGRLAGGLAYGLGVMAAMYAFGRAGAVQANPAVTLAVFATGNASLPRLVACLVGQCLGGAIAGGLAAWLLADAGTAVGLPVGELSLADPTKAVVVEAVLAAVWALTFLSCVVDGRMGGAAPLVVGLAVAGLAIAGIPWTGAAMNPARALASAVGSGDFATLWIGLAGPLAGGGVAGMAWRILPAARRSR
jgi:aquaporin Z